MIIGLAGALAAIAFFAGVCLMALGGVYLFALIAEAISTRIIERVLRTFDVYNEFLAFAMPRIKARWASRRKRQTAD